MTPKEILIQGRAKVERGWCQGFTALDANGEFTVAEGPHAVAFCAIGATQNYQHPGEEWAARHLIRQALGSNHGDLGIAEYNDAPGRTKAEILTLFDEAIKLAEKGEWV